MRVVSTPVLTEPMCKVFPGRVPVTGSGSAKPLSHTRREHVTLDRRTECMEIFFLCPQGENLFSSGGMSTCLLSPYISTVSTLLQLTLRLRTKGKRRCPPGPSPHVCVARWRRGHTARCPPTEAGCSRSWETCSRPTDKTEVQERERGLKTTGEASAWLFTTETVKRQIRDEAKKGTAFPFLNTL